ncbi:MAG: AAA family ATPase, partial [Mailhella sp.]
MEGNPQKSSRYYFSRHLWETLADIPTYGLTVIEAPSGFGKTTALREYLAREQKTADVRWYTCFGESTGRAWAGICALFSGQEGSITEELLELGEPSVENLADIGFLISGYACAKPTFLVIDNYQLFDSPVRKRCIAAFSSCRNENVHIILVTQPLKEEDNGATFHPHPYLNITQRDLFFDNQCIVEYCSLTGIDISQKQIDLLQATSRGWVAAIRLQLSHYRHTGNFIDFKEIRPLVETAIWNRLSPEKRNLIMALSLLESFNSRQAAIMNNGMALPDTIAEILSIEFF